MEQAGMEKRGKRVVVKPTRYQTTSSEEDIPKRRRTSTAQRPTIEQDIQDLATVLQDHDPTTSKGVPTLNENVMFQDADAANVPALEGYTDAGTSSARATVIHGEPLQRNTAPTQHPDNRSMEDLTGRDRIEAELTRMNTLLMSIQKTIQTTHNTGRPTKPAVLPLSSVQEVECFEDIDDDTYYKVVKYFEYVGGFDFKGAVKSCFKEALPDDLTLSYTWFGREGLKSFYDTRIAMAIFDGVCNNRKFDRPTRSDFQLRMQAELKAAKERVRGRKRGPRAMPSSSQEHRMPRSFWTEQQHQEEETDDL